MADLPLALILAGGIGSRLQSVVKDQPKALAQAGGIPFLDIQLRWLAREGGREVVLLTGYKGEQISEFVGNGSNWNLTVSCLREDSPLGTGGAVLNAVRELELGQNCLLLLNGDSLTEVSLSDFCDEGLPENEAKIGVVKQDDASRFGTVEFDEHHRLIGFSEKSRTTNEGWINSGIYFSPIGWFDDTLGDITPGSIERDLIPQWLSESRMMMRVYPIQGRFIDIGIPESFTHFQKIAEEWL